MDAMKQITVVIPHIPTRSNELVRAVASVTRQTLPARNISIFTDVFRDGSAITRNRGLYGITTPWVAFLDDDDELDENHLEVLVTAALATDATVVYSGCRILLNGVEVERREEWGRFGKPFDADLLKQMSYIPVTSLVNVYAARRALFGPPTGIATDYDDWGFYLRLLANGAHFVHVPQVTWTWHHHNQNTSGRPDRW